MEFESAEGTERSNLRGQFSSPIAALRKRWAMRHTRLASIAALGARPLTTRLTHSGEVPQASPHIITAGAATSLVAVASAISER